MIRKSVITILVMAAAGIYVLLWLSHYAPQHFATIDPSLVRRWDVRDGRVWFFQERNPRAFVDWDIIKERRIYVPWLMIQIDGYSMGTRSPYTRLEIGITLWPLIPILAAYPTIAFIRPPLRRWHRRRRGLCLECGYDLTGNVSGVCPECAADIGSAESGNSPDKLRS